MLIAFVPTALKGLLPFQPLYSAPIGLPGRIKPFLYIIAWQSYLFHALRQEICSTMPELVCNSIPLSLLVIIDSSVTGKVG